MIQRWLSIVLGLAVVAVAVGMTMQAMSAWRPDRMVAGDASDGGLRFVATPVYADDDAGDADLDLPIHVGPDTRADGGVGSRMPDGTMVPPLPDGTPKHVRFGVVLVTYAGAQFAPQSARSKHDAFDLAQKLAGDARSDFHSAVKRGDEGSNDDLGHIQRGILELYPEYVMFTLAPGQTSEPVDTPRGYWIIKRIE